MREDMQRLWEARQMKEVDEDKCTTQRDGVVHVFKEYGKYIFFKKKETSPAIYLQCKINTDGQMSD